MRTSKKLNLLFILDPVRKLDLRYDTTLSIMMESQKRAHHVFYAEAKNLYLENDRVFVSANSARISRTNNWNPIETKKIDLSSMDYVFVRKDPPVDLEYLYMTYILEFAPKKVRLVNDPKGIRDANEKIFGLRFKKFMPPSIVTSEAETILRFQKKMNSDLILKPLNDKGGHGILWLKKNSEGKGDVIQKATMNESRSVMAQKFIPKALKDGDKRILIWEGKILGAFGRVPKAGEYRANISCGGSFKKTTVTAREKRILRAINPVLKKMGLAFVGIDFIDGWITEINVTSPAGIVDLQELYGIRVEKTIVDALEK